MSQYKIAPSILATQIIITRTWIKRHKATGAEYAISIMDGHFVPQIGFGAELWLKLFALS